VPWSARLEVDAERRAFALLALDRDSSAVIAHYRLDDREAQTGAMRFGGVVRREEAPALLGGEALPGVGNFEACDAGQREGAQCERPSLGHRIDRVEHEIAEHARDLLGIGLHGA